MDHPSYITVFFIALIVSFVLTPLVRLFALKTGVLAMPGPRGVHKKPVPQLGGVAIFAGFSAALLATFGWDDPVTRSVILAGLAIVVLGVIDDILRLSPGKKLLGQAAVAGLAVAMGIRIEWLSHPFTDGIILLGGWGIPLTMLWIVAVVNVINLIDGLDGLAAGIASIAAVTLLITSLSAGLPWLSVALSAALMGGALGFLPFNFNPAKIFMGDAGSMFLGFGLAVVAVEGMLKTMTVVSITVPMLALGLPIADTFFAIVRRLRSGRPIGEADRQHLHHRLLDRGLSHRNAVLVLYSISAVFGVAAGSLLVLDPGQALLLIGVVGAGVYLLLRRAGLTASAAQSGRKLNM